MKECPTERSHNKHTHHEMGKNGREISFTCSGEGSPSPVPPKGGFTPPVGVDRAGRSGHYRGVVPDIECIQVVQHFNFNRGNVIKYVWRAGEKGSELVDLKKARDYLDFEIARLESIRGPEQENSS